MNIEEIYPKIPVGMAEDLSGKSFGSLIVLYRIAKDPNMASQSARWLCKCDCGTIKPILGQNLKKGSTTSCGCQNRKKASDRMKKYNEGQRTIKIGDVFGKLTVIEYEGLKKQKSRNKNESWYICKCKCGNIKSIRGNNLVSGEVISCGCIGSKGESIIKYMLDKNNINYIKEYTFPDLINPNTNHRLRFDFAVFDNNKLQYLIEFDGKQHYTGPDTETWGKGKKNKDTLEDIQYRDNLKNIYCKNNNIILKRIPYTALSNLSYDQIVGTKYNIN